MLKFQNVFCSHMVMVIDTYKYKGNDQYPSTMIEEHSEEGVAYIYSPGLFRGT